MKFDFTKSTVDEMMQRRSAILSELFGENEQLDGMSDEELRSKVTALEARDDLDTETLESRAAELEAIAAELEARKESAAAKETRMEGIAGKTGTKLNKMGGTRMNTYSIESPEYRSGFLKNLLDQEMTEEEKRAVSYVATTGDTTNGAANALPRVMLDKIWDMIDEQHSILEDIELYRTGTILELVKRTEISQGDAKQVDENAANDDEINKFAKVVLTGKDFSKHVDITYAMAQMSIDSFESFLISEIAERMGAALATDVVTQITGDYDSTNNKVETAESGAVVFTDVAKTLAALKNAKGQCVVYSNHATIYKYLVGMVDSTGRPIFQVNAQNGAEGTLVGCPVKVEDAVTGEKMLIGYPKQVVGNMIQDIMIESDRNIKKHVITYAGYARFECKLMAPKAFAVLEVTEGE